MTKNKQELLKSSRVLSFVFRKHTPVDPLNGVNDNIETTSNTGLSVHCGRVYHRHRGNSNKMCVHLFSARQKKVHLEDDSIGGRCS